MFPISWHPCARSRVGGDRFEFSWTSNKKAGFVATNQSKTLIAAMRTHLLKETDDRQRQGAGAWDVYQNSGLWLVNCN